MLRVTVTSTNIDYLYDMKIFIETEFLSTELVSNISVRQMIGADNYYLSVDIDKNNSFASKIDNYYLTHNTELIGIMIVDISNGGYNILVER